MSFPINSNLSSNSGYSLEQAIELKNAGKTVAYDASSESFRLSETKAGRMWFFVKTDEQKSIDTANKLIENALINKANKSVEDAGGFGKVFWNTLKEGFSTFWKDTKDFVAQLKKDVNDDSTFLGKMSKGWTIAKDEIGKVFTKMFCSDKKVTKEASIALQQPAKECITTDITAKSFKIDRSIQNSSFKELAKIVKDGKTNVALTTKMNKFFRNNIELAANALGVKYNDILSQVRDKDINPTDYLSKLSQSAKKGLPPGMQKLVDLAAISLNAAVRKGVDATDRHFHNAQTDSFVKTNTSVNNNFSHDFQAVADNNGVAGGFSDIGYGALLDGFEDQTDVGGLSATDEEELLAEYNELEDQTDVGEMTDEEAEALVKEWESELENGVDPEFENCVDPEFEKAINDFAANGDKGLFKAFLNSQYKGDASDKIINHLEHHPEDEEFCKALLDELRNEQ